jgi:hypothetical protein
VLAALGPWGQQATGQLESLLKAKVDELDSVLIAVIANQQGELQTCLRVVFVSPWTDEELTARLPGSGAAAIHGAAYRTLNGLAYFLAPAGGACARALIVSPVGEVKSLLASGGEAPALVRDIESLVERSDADRMATVIVAPKFLQAAGNDLLVSAAAPLHDAAEWLIGDEVAVVSISAHWDDNFFAELRAAPTLNMPPRRLATKLLQQIAAAPDEIEAITLAAPWSPYGRKVLARFPAMLRALARYTRADEADRQAIVRAYLPPQAGHNLLMAAELLLTQPREGAAVTDAEPAPHPKTLRELLAVPTSLKFSKETLERALELLAEDAGIEITIRGADLQAEGITKNQSLALDLRGQPAGEILLEILLRANPDRTTTGPGDSRQKLVYVVEEQDEAGPGRIIVTTRTAATRRAEPLPDEFMPMQP